MKSPGGQGNGSHSAPRGVKMAVFTAPTKGGPNSPSLRRCPQSSETFPQWASFAAPMNGFAVCWRTHSSPVNNPSLSHTIYQHRWVSRAATTIPISLPQPSLPSAPKASNVFSMIHTAAQKPHIKTPPWSSGFDEHIRIVYPLYLNREISVKVFGNLKLYFKIVRVKFRTLVIKESVIQSLGPPPGRNPKEETDYLLSSRKRNSTNWLVIYPRAKFS